MPLVKICFPIIGVGIKRRKEKNKIEQLPDCRNQLEVPHLLDGAVVHDMVNKLNLLICCTDGVNNVEYCKPLPQSAQSNRGTAILKTATSWLFSSHAYL